MSKAMWLIVCMGGLTAFLMSIAMMFSLGQFQETPVADWVKLAEIVQNQFKLDHVSVHVSIRTMPAVLSVSYLTRVNSNFDLTQQNNEMNQIARFAIDNYRGRELRWIEKIKVTRSETHGSGCFQQTYVAHYSIDNPNRQTGSQPPQNVPPEK